MISFLQHHGMWNTILSVGVYSIFFVSFGLGVTFVLRTFFNQLGEKRAFTEWAKQAFLYLFVIALLATLSITGLQALLEFFNK
jgi:hypothetical protein